MLPELWMKFDISNILTTLSFQPDVVFHRFQLHILVAPFGKLGHCTRSPSPHAPSCWSLPGVAGKGKTGWETGGQLAWDINCTLKGPEMLRALHLLWEKNGDVPSSCFDVKEQKKQATKKARFPYWFHIRFQVANGFLLPTNLRTFRLVCRTTQGSGNWAAMCITRRWVSRCNRCDGSNRVASPLWVPASWFCRRLLVGWNQIPKKNTQMFGGIFLRLRFMHPLLHVGAVMDGLDGRFLWTKKQNRECHGQHLNVLGDCIVDDLAVATNAIELDLPA